MQPMINIALRSIRATNEQIQLILDREELSFTDPEKLKRVITRVDGVFYDDLSKALQRAYPNHIVAKKGDLKGGKGYTWHIMPIHNTTSLARGLSDWCFSVICKKNDQPEHALVVCPLSGDEYTATRGGGASHNGKRLRVSKIADLQLALISTNLLEKVVAPEKSADYFETYRELEKDCFGIRSAHCIPLELCRVAAGNLDISLLKGISLQETAAGLLIAKEAGGLTSDFAGNPSGDRSSSLICCNPKLLKPIAPKLQRVKAA
ncbi:MAG: inositol monophosphatase [Hahellaceae bacterium]|nr:inositol monophosphatase [Hahellaceae bacterium]